MISIFAVNQMVDQFSNLIKKYASDTDKATIQNLLFKPSLASSTPKPGESLKNVETFTTFLGNYQDFTTLLPSGTISIGASIDVPNQSASLYVSSPENLQNANKPLNDAFMAYYGASPSGAIKKIKTKLLQEMKQNPDANLQDSLNAKAQHDAVVVLL